MNKKFSTLLAGAAFLSAVSVNSVYAQGVQDKVCQQRLVLILSLS